jgi:hypothetical protein
MHHDCAKLQKCGFPACLAALAKPAGAILALFSGPIAADPHSCESAFFLPAAGPLEETSMTDLHKRSLIKVAALSAVAAAALAGCIVDVREWEQRA